MKRDLLYSIYQRRNRNKLDVHDGAETGVYEVHEDFLLACAELFSGSEQIKCLETGAGLTTVVFAVWGWANTAITPSDREVEGILSWLKMSEFSYLEPRFIVGKSFEVLPGYEAGPIDFALIDGNHALPHVFVDFFFIALKLRVGGYLAVDDINLAGPRQLSDYVMSRSYFSLVCKTKKWAIFQLTEISSLATDDWNN